MKRRLRFLIINTDYEHFIQDCYRRNPALRRASFAEQHETRMRSFFGMNDFYSRNLKALGCEAIDLIYNNPYMQMAYALDHGLMRNSQWDERSGKGVDGNVLALLFHAQVRHYRPDVIVNLAMETVTSAVLKPVRDQVGLIIGQHAAPLAPAMDDLSAYDLVISSLPNLVQYFNGRGRPSRYFQLGFEAPLATLIPTDSPRTVDVAFVGGFSSAHAEGLRLFEYLAEAGIKMTLYGYGGENLSPLVRRFLNPPVYGRQMYEVYAKAKIVVNRHIDISGKYANNMRMYEATGMGALLLTDMKENLSNLFIPGKEVVAYSNPHQCVREIRSLLKDPTRRKAIAFAGQKRTIETHSYRKRMEELVQIVEKELRWTVPCASIPDVMKGQVQASKPSAEGAAPDSDPFDGDFCRVAADRDLDNIARLAALQRMGRWAVVFQGMTIYCRDLLSFYVSAKNVFIERIYDFQTSRADPVVIDGGGQIGLFTLYVKMKYPNAKVTVFEPDGEYLSLLRANLSTNECRDVRVVPSRLYKYEGIMRAGRDKSSGAPIFSADANRNMSVVRLGNYINKNVDFLKLDMEGAELEVLRDVAGQLPYVRELAVKYYGIPQLGRRLRQILEILERAGFKSLVHDLDALTTSAAKPPSRLATGTGFLLVISGRRIFAGTPHPPADRKAIERTRPVSRKFGLDRGKPIDRYYIELFLNRHRDAIRGCVLEIGDDRYTRYFGMQVTQKDVLSAVAGPGVTIVGDLASGKGIPRGFFDCILMTQTLQMIFNLRAALLNTVNALKPGGALLLSASGISQISRYDMDRWGEFWRFTDRSMERLLKDAAPSGRVTVETFGNVATAKAFLDGLACEDVPQDILARHDPDYQVVLCARLDMAP
ncbi:MAG: FkbM family methyltransferase [Deltaproteobacteria bacterium]|nr:FkbM family methyltransferase [Deltaproteobacteria bacterium]